ncbi:uromodulin isoform X1 [Nematostella vectensis]|uniref:uromodulin isoform X1 n=2 Tax=Nematostella vectensis TaxID=45351 RepID=UPI0013905511|nr:uromodulin isoform X1 [Nematostella vectensis]
MKATMASLTVFALLLGPASITGLQKPEFVGCYKANGDRPMPQFLASYRTKEYLKEWNQDEFDAVVRNCAAETEKHGFLYFGVQFWGECWSGPRAHLTYDDYGKTEKDSECKKYHVGGDFEIAVYRLLGAEDECSNSTYKVLDTADRLETHKTESPKCDTQMGGWYRFQSEAGDVIATSCPPMSHCGTYITGWMKGGLPYDVIDKSVEREACFHKSDENCCLEKRTIKARNCGKFFVFKLENAPLCGRYCGHYIEQVDIGR